MPPIGKPAPGTGTGKPIRGTFESHGVSRSKETLRTTDAKKRNVTTVTTRADQTHSTETSSTAHTSRKGNVTTKEKSKTEETRNAGVSREMEVELASTDKTLIERGAKEKHVEGSLPGGVKTDAYFQGPSFKMEGSAGAKQSGFGVDVDVSLKIDANLFKAGASAEKEFKFKVGGEEVSVKVKLGAEGQVGINGELKLKLHVGKDGISIQAGAEGFAGAKGTLSGTIEAKINGNEVGAGEIKLTASAGVAAGAEFEAGLTHFRTKAYLAVGVGLGIEISGKVNAANLAKGGAAVALPFHQGW